MYRKIIYRHCRQPGQGNGTGILRAFNVNEIVGQAMALRRISMLDAVGRGQKPESWVLNIWDPRLPPDLAHAGEERQGQENMNGEQSDVEEDTVEND